MATIVYVLLGVVLLTNLNKMKVTVNQDNRIQLEEVFNHIILKTKDGEEMTICMRDSGFEFKYQGKWYFAKEGCVEPLMSIRQNDKRIEMNEINNERHLMTSNVDKGKCPKCGAIEVDAMTPKTVYECGSSDYDQRPNTFSQSEECKRSKTINIIKNNTTLT